MTESVFPRTTALSPGQRSDWKLLTVVSLAEAPQVSRSGPLTSSAPREAVELADRRTGHPSVRLSVDLLSISLVSYPRIYHLSIT